MNTNNEQRNSFQLTVAIVNTLAQIKASGTETTQQRQSLMDAVRYAGIMAAREGREVRAFREALQAGVLANGGPKSTASLYASAAAGFAVRYTAATDTAKAEAKKAGIELGDEAIANIAEQAITAGGEKGKPLAKEAGVKAWQEFTETPDARKVREAVEQMQVQAQNIATRLRAVSKTAEHLPKWPEFYAALSAILPIGDTVTVTKPDKAERDAAKAAKLAEDKAAWEAAQAAEQAAWEASHNADETEENEAAPAPVAVGQN